MEGKITTHTDRLRHMEQCRKWDILPGSGNTAGNSRPSSIMRMLATSQLSTAGSTTLRRSDFIAFMPTPPKRMLEMRYERVFDRSFLP